MLRKLRRGLPCKGKVRLSATICAIAVSSVNCLAGDARFPAIPKEGTVIESRAVPSSVARDRFVVLWMLKPEKHDRGPLTKDNMYTCPETTMGSYWEGPTRVSLYDSAQHVVINTLSISYPDVGGDAFAIPYRIGPKLYYYVPPGRVLNGEGKPEILHFRDYSGDGVAVEFAFYHALSCMGLPTTLLGYSTQQDRVIQYPFTLKVTEDGATKQETLLWIDYVLSNPPVRPGQWRFSIDYRGRGGALDTYDIRYDAAAERFTGSRVSVSSEPR